MKGNPQLLRVITAIKHLLKEKSQRGITTYLLAQHFGITRKYEDLTWIVMKLCILTKHGYLTNQREKGCRVLKVWTPTPLLY